MSEEIKTSKKKSSKKKVEKEDSELDLLSKLMKKVDSLTKEVKALKEDSEEKEDSDPRDILLEKGAKVFRTLLKDNLSEEKLDSMPFNELILAYELKAEIKEEKGNKIEEKQDAKTLTYAEKMLRPRFV